MSLMTRPPAGVLLLTLSLVALLPTSRADADILFSNLPFSAGRSGLITGPAEVDFGYQELAALFTVSETATLDSIIVPFHHNNHGNDANDAITITLYTSVNNLPGVTLASQLIPANTLTATPTLTTLTFSNGPLLTAGSSYFVGAAATGTTNDGWNSDLSNTNFLGAARFSPNNAFSAASFNVAFQVNGTAVAVPEPGSVALLVGLTTVGAGFLVRKRRRVE